MANIIKPRRTLTVAKVPTTSDLEDGELGINAVDGKTYIRVGSTIYLVGEAGGVQPGDLANVAFSGLYSDLVGVPKISTSMIKSCVVSTAASTAAKVGTMDTDPEPGDLVLVQYTLGTTASNATLNINDTGAKNVRVANANASSVAHTTAALGKILYHYDGDYFHLVGSQRNSDSDTTTYSAYTGSTTVDGVGLTRNKFVMENPDGTYTGLSVGNTTANTKVQTATPLNMYGRLMYYSGTGTVAANGATTGWIISGITPVLSYTFNSAGAYVLGSPLYLVGTVDSNGYLILDQTDATSWYTQVLPTSDDGRVYLRVGTVYSATNIALDAAHVVLWYKAGRIRQYPDTGASGSVSSVGLSAPTGFNVSGSPVTGSGTLALTYDTGYQGYTTAEASKLSGIAAGATVGATWGTDLAGIPAHITSWAGIDPGSKFDTPSGTINQYVRGDGSLSHFPVVGNGLTLVANNIVLGTPSAVTLSSTNSVSSTSHTHAFSPGGTTAQYIRGDGSLATFPTVGSGTVTSVGLSMPTGFSVAGSPVTNGGTLTVTYAPGYTPYTTAEASKLAGIAAGAQVNVPTNLSQGTRTSTAVPVNSSTGASATLQAATASLAGVMSAADKSKLDGLNASSFVNTTGNQTGIAGDKSWTGVQSFVAGTNWGSRVAASPTDLSEHISLHASGYGLTITGNRLNYVVPMGASHRFIINGVDEFYVDASGAYTTGSYFDNRGNVRKLPVNTQNANYVFTTADFNQAVEKSDNNSYNYTLNNIGAQGQAITVVNSGTAGNITIARGTGVSLYRNGTNANIVVGPGSMVTIYRSATSGRWIA